VVPFERRGASCAQIVDGELTARIPILLHMVNCFYQAMLIPW
jgi:hypothetical protein